MTKQEELQRFDEEFEYVACESCDGLIGLGFIKPFISSVYNMAYKEGQKKMKEKLLKELTEAKDRAWKFDGSQLEFCVIKEIIKSL